MTIYISLPITGYDEADRRELCESAKEFIRQRFISLADAISPFDIAPIVRAEHPEPDYGDFMGADIAVLIRRADAVLFLVNPERTPSKGVRLEYACAQIFGKQGWIARLNADGSINDCIKIL